MSRRATPKRYALLWVTGRGEDLSVNTLVYRPDGLVRTYEKDKLDPRIGEVVVAENYEAALDALSDRSPGEGSPKVLMPVPVAKRIYGHDEQYAPAGYGIYGG